MAKTFRSERLVYRAVEESDDEFFLHLDTDTEAYLNRSPFLAQPPGKKSAKGNREWLDGCLLSVIICLPLSPASPPSMPDGDGDGKKERQKPKAIGFIHLSGAAPMTQHHRRAGIGLGIDREYQAKGYGTEAAQWILNWAFTMGNLHRVEIGAFGYNERAAALYQRLGFKLEGRRREWIFFQGRYWDLIEMGMLEHEWKKLHCVKAKEDVMVHGDFGP